MDEINFKQFFKKSGQLLEKYRSNIDHLTKLRKDMEMQFFTPDEMVEFFHENKSEYYTWQVSQESIISLEEAYYELVGNLMDALNNQTAFKYYLKDQRLPVLVHLEPNEVIEEEQDTEADLEDN